MCEAHKKVEVFLIHDDFFMEKMENKEKKKMYFFVSKEATNIFKLFTAIFYDYLSGNVFSSFLYIEIQALGAYLILFSIVMCLAKRIIEDLI